MEAQFELTVADYEAQIAASIRLDHRYLKVAQRLRRTTVVNSIPLLFIIPLVISGFAFLFGLPRSVIPPVLVAGALLGAAYAASRIRLRPYMELLRKHAISQEGWCREYLGSTRVKLQEDGVRYVGKYQDHLIRWNGIACVTDTAEHIVLGLGALGTVVPKRAFASTGEATAFLENARSLREAAGIEENAELRAFLVQREIDCPVCGYGLRGLTGGLCPECGLWLDASALRETVKRTR